MKAKPLIFAFGGMLAGIVLATTFFRFQNKQQSVLPLTPTPLVESITAESTPQPTSDLVIVTKVIDGDTIEIEGGTRVRLIGIDTPETVDPRTLVQCFGREASNKTKELLEGKAVRLEKDISETDRYGRLLRYIYLGDIFINEALVRDGFAYASSFPPDIKYQPLLTSAQSQAKAANRGLWGTCASPTPLPSATTLTLGATTTNQNQAQTQSTIAPVITGTGNCDIKGNISSTGEKIYHMPGQNFYDRTVIDESKGERWFCNESEAVAAGWRKSLK